MTRRSITIIKREGDACVAIWPGLDIARTGATVSEARASLNEELELFFETASTFEIQRRLRDEVVL